MLTKEIETMREVEVLQTQLELAVNEAVKSGELAVAREIKNEIAHRLDSIRDSLDPLRRLGLNPHLRHLVESERASLLNLNVGGKDRLKLIREMNLAGIWVESTAKEMMKTTAFITSPLSRPMTFLKISVEELRPLERSTKMIYETAKSNGLELCPMEAAPYLRMAYQDQSMAEWLGIAMNPIMLSDGSHHIFNLAYGWDKGIIFTDYILAERTYWTPSHNFIFKVNEK